MYSVGSGGATLNALLQVAEYLSALAGHTVVSPETLVNSRVLIIHMVCALQRTRGGAHRPVFKLTRCKRTLFFVAFLGLGRKAIHSVWRNDGRQRRAPRSDVSLVGDLWQIFWILRELLERLHAHHISPRSSCAASVPSYNVDILMQTMARITKASPYGVWVCSTEMLLKLPTVGEEAWQVNEKGITVVAIPGTTTDAAKHGVYKVRWRSDVVHQFTVALSCGCRERPALVAPVRRLFDECLRGVMCASII